MCIRDRNEFLPSVILDGEESEFLKKPKRVGMDLKQDSRRRIAKTQESEKIEDSEKKIEIMKTKEVQKEAKFPNNEVSNIRKALHRKRPKKNQNTLPTKSKKTKTRSKSSENEISMDVKRTYANRKDFDHVSLEQILRNIAHPKMGKFPYYQGINYVVAYLSLIHI